MSVLLAIAMSVVGVSQLWQAAAWLTALDAMCSDLFGLPASSHRQDLFHCGNFGVVMLNKEHRDKVIDILKEMIRITMMRGAQSGGVITYVKNGTQGVKGIRSRVVNGKRTDLSEIIVGKLKSDQRFAPLLDGPRIYAGHTRFATTSKASFDGTHPHQVSLSSSRSLYRNMLRKKSKRRYLYGRKRASIYKNRSCRCNRKKKYLDL